MAFCVNCGTKVEEGIKFCPSCGTQVGASGVSINQEKADNFIQPQPAVLPTAPQTQSAVMADEMYCFSCGSVIKKIAEICPKCGVKQSVQGLTNKNLRTLALVSIILLTVVPIISFFYWEILYRALNIWLEGVGKGINILWNVTDIGANVIGIIVFNKLKKNIGVALSNTLTILLCILSVIQIFYLFRSLSGI